VPIITDSAGVCQCEFSHWHSAYCCFESTVPLVTQEPRTLNWVLNEVIMVHSLAGAQSEQQ
jgi:hypothetical protein